MILPEGYAPVSTASLHLPLRHRVPAEIQLPVEPAPRHVRPRDVLKRIITYYVYDGAHNRRPVRYNKHHSKLGLYHGTQ